MPTISVLLPVYNAVNDLPRALKSLLNQTYHDFEIIAIDDGSTDGSGELLDSYAHSDQRIRVFHQSNAGALGKVLNRAAELAQGKYIARQDADDASAPTRLEKQVNYLDTHPETGLSGIWTWYIDSNLGPLFSLEIPDDHTRLCYYLSKGFNPFVHGSVMLRANLFKELGGYRGSYAEDFDLWIRLSEITRLGMCTDLGYYFWRSMGGISAGAHLRQQALIKLVHKLQAERAQYGREITEWDSEYQKIMDAPTAESSLEERNTFMHYARGLQLLRRKRLDAARTELRNAAAGQGIYAQKAKRNLSFFWLAPVLTMIYQLRERQEPFHFARRLPENTQLPSFIP
jgi:glycosyltransferase involved in cell wall biosynthesis